MNYGQMQQQSWGLSRKDYTVDEEDEVPARNDSFNDPRSDEDEDEDEEEEEKEEQLTMKPANMVKSAAQKIREKKQQEADARAQELA